MMAPLQIGLVGFGKIAADQHLPAIATSSNFELRAVASGSRPRIEGIPAVYPTLSAMLQAEPRLDAVAICTPPGPRPALVGEAIRAGRHVLLEKPPAATLSEAETFNAMVVERGPTLFAAWHSRFNPAVLETRRLLARQDVERVRVTWKEDVRHWHPAQDWVWEPGGFGVFDPAINALSILTEILPSPMAVGAARLHFPANRATPIAAELTLRLAIGDTCINAEFDWRQTSPQTWDIEIDTRSGTTLRLSDGGSRLWVGEQLLVNRPSREYPAIYERFAELIRDCGSDVDLSPLRLVSDAFLIGRRVETDAFEW